MFNAKNEYNDEVEFTTIEGYDRQGEKIQSKDFLNKSLFTIFIIGTMGAIGYFGYTYFIQKGNEVSPSPMKAVMGISITTESKDNLNRDDIKKGLDTIYQEEQSYIQQEKEINDVVNQLIMVKETKISTSKDISNEINGMVDMFYTQEAIHLKLGDMVDDFYMANTPPENSNKKSRYVTVKEGNTLAGIAQKFYGNAMKYQKIIDANERLKKDTHLYIGEKINIPY